MMSSSLIGSAAMLLRWFGQRNNETKFFEAADAIDHEKTGLICDGNNLDAIYSSINSLSLIHI